MIDEKSKIIEEEYQDILKNRNRELAKKYIEVDEYMQLTGK
jgi:hypothetical protein